MRWFALILLVSACGAPAPRTLQTIEGEPIEFAYVWLAPFCLFLCNTQVSTTGSQIKGAGSNTQNTSQTISSERNGD